MQFAKEYLLPCRASPIHVYTVSFPPLVESKSIPRHLLKWMGWWADGCPCLLVVVETLNCVVVAVVGGVKYNFPLALWCRSSYSLIILLISQMSILRLQKQGTSQELYSWSTVETKIQTQVSDLSRLYGVLPFVNNPVKVAFSQGSGGLISFVPL